MQQQQQRKRQQQQQRQQQRGHAGGAAYHSGAACVPRPLQPAVAPYASVKVQDGGAPWDGRLGGGGVVGGLGGGGLLGSLGGGGVLGLGLGGLDRDRLAAEARTGGRDHANTCDAVDADDADAYLGEIRETILVESIRLTMLSLEQEIRAQDITHTRRNTKTRGEPRVHTLLERVYMLNSSTTHTRL